MFFLGENLGSNDIMQRWPLFTRLCIAPRVLIVNPRRNAGKENSQRGIRNIQAERVYLSFFSKHSFLFSFLFKASRPRPSVQLACS